MSEKTLLAIGAHHDDTEYACGGLIVQAVRRGWRVVSVDMCGDHGSWQPTVGREDEVRDRLLEVSAIMGVEKRFFGWRYHHLYYEEEAVQRLAQLVGDLQPDLGLIHWPHDYWPDHEAAGKLGKHALWFPHGLFRDAKLNTKLLAYEAGANQTDPAVPFRPDVYVNISDVMDQVREVIRRIDEIVSGAPVKAPSGHELDKAARSRLRGSECGVAYAEAFVALKKWPQEILT